ncbi:MAG TPA: hypothetical protein PLN48_03120 [Lachnospiraceae bacterium]|nr:hypothetical protein [Lachnospiraceae bacterium]
MPGEAFHGSSRYRNSNSCRCHPENNTYTAECRLHIASWKVIIPTSAMLKRRQCFNKGCGALNGIAVLLKRIYGFNKECRVLLKGKGRSTL